MCLQGRALNQTRMPSSLHLATCQTPTRCQPLRALHAGQGGRQVTKTTPQPWLQAVHAQSREVTQVPAQVATFRISQANTGGHVPTAGPQGGW